ncbi:hypothetical protein EcWSU1_A060 (plasmid) [Enterobacter ludwigii]|uniref:Uncharacterized protein n=1 Tax=Enterobacter ludwigii TaxID=299767 RepID=G8LQD8_9ENTR|nr:hypothetical protein EcWSU1_A060 [Enterobacter ludwigii]
MLCLRAKKPCLCAGLKSMLLEFIFIISLALLNIQAYYLNVEIH